MLQRISVRTFFENMNTKVFFLLLFLYQLIFIFQGLDFLDEGFTATFYQQFFHDPSSVEYNFMFWLSGLIGGTFTYLFPDTGLLGLRFLSILFTMATILIVYNMLKNYLNKTNLKIGLLLVTLCVCHNPKIFHYNFLSILLYSATASLLFSGLKKDKWWLFSLSGAVVGLDVFSRLPSLVNLGLVVAIAYYGFLSRTPFKKIITQGVSFFAGFAVSVVTVILVIKTMGQLDTFVNAFKLVTQMGQSDGETAYSIPKLILQSVNSYNDSFFFTLYILALIFISAVVPDYLRKKFHFKDWAVRLVKYFSLLLAFLIMLKGLEILMRFYAGLTLISFVLILLSDTRKEIKTLMLIGTYITFTYALGSSAGIFTAGVHIFWIGMPIAIDYILNIKDFNYRFSISAADSKGISNYSSTNEQQFHFRPIKSYIITISIVGCIYHQWFYPMHDESSRLGMFSTIDNKYVKGIFTTQQRVDATNELLNASSRFVKPDDYVLAFHSFPIYHYMTHTKPYTRNSMPWYYVSGAFKTQLYKAVEDTKILPVVVVQKIKTTPNDHSDWPDAWPSDPIFHKPETDTRTIRQQAYMDEFLTKYEYHVAWENDIFKIMTTDKKP
ncbi:MAG: glycosyltransferase family 39 protein [Chitinophagaceae bacterium]